MTPLLGAPAVLLAAAALLTGATSRRERSRRRLRRVVMVASHAVVSAGSTRRRPVRRRAGRRAVAGCVGVGVALVAASVLNAAGGAVVGAAAGIAGGRIVGRLPNGGTPARVLADLPLGLDLVAACLAAGAPLVRALEVATEAVGGPLGDELAVVAHALRLGGGPEQACARWRSPDAAPTLAAAARAFGRADESGSRLAGQLFALADRERRTAHARALETARQVGIAAVAPWGCASCRPSSRSGSPPSSWGPPGTCCPEPHPELPRPPPAVVAVGPPSSPARRPSAAGGCGRSSRNPQITSSWRTSPCTRITLVFGTKTRSSP